MSPPGGGRHDPLLFRHRLFGLNIESDFNFVNRTSAATGHADLRIETLELAPELELEGRAPVFESPIKTEDGDCLSTLYRLEQVEVLRFSRAVDFILGKKCIACHLLEPSYSFLVEIRLLGPVLSYWLERRGIPTLHASAVKVGSRAVAFLSSGKGGKTSLGATFVQAGHALLTDDVLPLRFGAGTIVAVPGYPQMRMWPDTADHFVGHHQDLELIHPYYDKRRVPVGQGFFGSFCDRSVPLAALYLPERNEDGGASPIEIEPVPPREAMIELIRNSFSPHLVEAACSRTARLEFFSRVLETVPMCRLRFPSGFRHLSRVHDAILEDLELSPP